MKYKIHYDLERLYSDFWDEVVNETGGEDLVQAVIDDSVKMLSADWLNLYKKLISGSYDFLTYETGKDKNTGRSLVYLFTRSARQNVQIQKTCFLSVPGSDDLLPVSHRDFRTFDDFRRDGFPDGVTVTAA
jgi:hypothetical protein